MNTELTTWMGGLTGARRHFRRSVRLVCRFVRVVHVGGKLPHGFQAYP